MPICRIWVKNMEKWEKLARKKRITKYYKRKTDTTVEGEKICTGN
jgi:hypothetical protein